MKHFYRVWGSILVAGVLASHYFGWGFTETDEAKGIPKSVRENPGAYRTHYVGGK
jgi:hypothetical protein